MGTGAPVTGVATASGRWDQPRLRAELVHPRTPLLDRVAFDLAWSGGLLTLKDLTGAGLRAHGTMPLSWGRPPAPPGGTPPQGGCVWGRRIWRWICAMPWPDSARCSAPTSWVSCRPSVTCAAP
ncbi:hypothetical protein [Cyanobium sp. ATX-6F1]|uniref:hypothetical protein n=1 Tax=Cyanobium sp. ATX-6F1 TaxID=3137388 RepID=UPI0039BE03E0